MREKKLELPLKQGVSCRAVQCNISNKRIRAKNSTAAFLGTEPCQAGAHSWVPFLPRQTLMDIGGGRHRVSTLAFRWGTQWKKPNEGIAVICSVFDTENYDLLVERFALLRKFQENPTYSENICRVLLSNGLGMVSRAPENKGRGWDSWAKRSWSFCPPTLWLMPRHDAKWAWCRLWSQTFLDNM